MNHQHRITKDKESMAVRSSNLREGEKDGCLFEFVYSSYNARYAKIRGEKKHSFLRFSHFSQPS